MDILKGAARRNVLHSSGVVQTHGKIPTISVFLMNPFLPFFICWFHGEQKKVSIFLTTVPLTPHRHAGLVPASRKSLKSLDSGMHQNAQNT